MDSLKVHHIGYLVKKINAASVAFRKLGYAVTEETVYDEGRGVDICFLEKDGCVIELVSPRDETSVVWGLFRKYKNCPYHICYETPRFSEDLEHLASDGYAAIGEPAPAPALGGRRVAFLMSPVIGMIELLEA